MYYWNIYNTLLIIHLQYQYKINNDYNSCLSISDGNEVSFKTYPILIHTPIQEVIPKVVAIAVNTVMMMLRIFPQMFLFIVMSFKL